MGVEDLDIYPFPNVGNNPFYESMYKDEKDIISNFSEWKPEEGKNVLLITGLPGSGKTTIAIEMANKHNAEMFQMDWIESPQYMKSAKDLPNHGLCKYIKEHHWNIIIRAKDAPDDEYYKTLLTVFESIMDYAKIHHDKLFIVEGIQLVSFFDYPNIKKIPIIIKGTSVSTSLTRQLRRDGENVYKDKDKNLLLDFHEKEKYLNKFRKMFI